MSDIKPMTVSHLINELKKLPQDAEVLIEESDFSRLMPIILFERPAEPGKVFLEAIYDNRPYKLPYSF